jgi:hypothetical protein
MSQDAPLRRSDVPANTDSIFEYVNPRQGAVAGLRTIQSTPSSSTCWGVESDAIKQCLTIAPHVPEALYGEQLACCSSAVVSGPPPNETALTRRPVDPYSRIQPVGKESVFTVIGQVHARLWARV